MDMPQAVNEILHWSRDDRGQACRFVVTPNVNHVVLLSKRRDFAAAYADASLVLADGEPLVRVARWLGRRLPGRVAGSDLAPALFEAARRGEPLKVFLLGAKPGVAERAAANVEQRFSGVRIVGTCSPTFGFEADPVENEQILQRLAVAQPQVLIVGFGAPKQELWVHRHRHQLAARVALCLGATIDFLAGGIPRAPSWMSAAGLEWTFRIACEPRRLAVRYLRDALAFAPLLWKEWRETSGMQPGSPAAERRVHVSSTESRRS
jgi:N-acetylglucosaminyldiphosphoundecaprenol N-acetyl-beta-D-mannosaminyltransferase